MRQRPLAVLLGLTLAMGWTLASPGVSHAAPQASLPDAELTIQAPGPPEQKITQSFAFDSVNQEFVADASGTVGDLAVTFTAVGSPDPSISYQLGVDSAAAGIRELFVRLVVPISPLGQPDSVSATLNVDLVDANSNGAAVSVVGSLPMQEARAVVEPDFTPPISVLLPVSLATEDITLPGNFDFSAGPVPGPAPDPFGSDVFSAMEVRAHFEISPGDRVTLTGTATTVPEPSSAAILVGLGSALVLLGRGRSRDS